MRRHSIHGIVANENVKAKADTRVRTVIKINADRSDIMSHDKKRHEIILIEVGDTGQDRLTAVEIEKRRK
ncbi:unnamed protein product [Thelazia callipaeda]|uniref:Hva1_TUDOR domain-containing protein n=1 Tax=Thelazia callipaeda TaxID=103827 RepID=A0A0N5CN46_THECL|nr:unnamed protein product [Thelazia callipaeda]